MVECKGMRLEKCFICESCNLSDVIDFGLVVLIGRFLKLNEFDFMVGWLVFV